jgi:hypothetical protein
MNIAAAVVVLDKQRQKAKRPMETLTSYLERMPAKPWRDESESHAVRGSIVPSAADQFTSPIDLMQDFTGEGKRRPRLMDETEDGHPASCLIRIRTAMILNMRIDWRRSLMPRQLGQWTSHRFVRRPDRCPARLSL